MTSDELDELVTQARGDDDIADQALEGLEERIVKLTAALGDLIEVADGALAMIDAKRKRGDFDHWESFEMGDFGLAIHEARAVLNGGSATAILPGVK